MKNFGKTALGGMAAALLLAGCGKSETKTETQETAQPAATAAPAAEAASASSEGGSATVKAPDSAGSSAQYQEFLRKRNERLASPEVAAASAAALAEAKAAPEAKIKPEDVPLDGDQVMVDVKVLELLIPGMDTSKMERKEPIEIGALLKQRGVALTSYEQLRDMGITNFTVVRASQPAQAQPQ